MSISLLRYIKKNLTSLSPSESYSGAGGSELRPWRTMSLSCTTCTHANQLAPKTGTKRCRTWFMFCHAFAEPRDLLPCNGTSCGESTSIRTTRSGGLGEDWSSFRTHIQYGNTVVHTSTLTANWSINRSSSSSDNLLLFRLLGPLAPVSLNSGGAKPSSSSVVCTGDVHRDRRSSH